MFFARPFEVIRKLHQIFPMKFPEGFTYLQPSRSVYPLGNRPANTLTMITKKRYIFSISRNVKIQTIYNVGFHTTISRPQGLPPGAWVIILKILKRVLQTKRLYVSDKVHNNMRTLTVGGLILSLLGFSFYVTHLEESPITKRKRFIIISEKEIQKMALQESDKVLKQYEGKVAKSGKAHDYVAGISDKILKANKHLPGIKKDWSVFVINDNVLNAFVLPNGHIFVFSGMVDALNNEDQLAAIMGHEIAHALLNHIGELLSKTSIFQLILLVTLAVLWIILPNALADTSQPIAESIGEILFKLPMNRKLEIEADVVGVQMMARACFDPREAVELWKKMAKTSKGGTIELLSTHPSHKTRAENLKQLMPEAMDIYSKHCKS